MYMYTCRLQHLSIYVYIHVYLQAATLIAVELVSLVEGLDARKVAQAARDGRILLYLQR